MEFSPFIAIDFFRSVKTISDRKCNLTKFMVAHILYAFMKILSQEHNR